MRVNAWHILYKIYVHIHIHIVPWRLHGPDNQRPSLLNASSTSSSSNRCKLGKLSSLLTRRRTGGHPNESLACLQQVKRQFSHQYFHFLNLKPNAEYTYTVKQNCSSKLQNIITKTWTGHI